jgi:hypothetical protein
MKPDVLKPDVLWVYQIQKLQRFLSRAVDAQHRGLETQHGALRVYRSMVAGSITLMSKSGSTIVKIQKHLRLNTAVDAHNGGSKRSPWSVYRPAVADSHHFDEEQDPDPHLIEVLDPDQH